MATIFFTDIHQAMMDYTGIFTLWIKLNRIHVSIGISHM